ncbi:MAG: S1C family serine protease [Rubrobacteraceae bacterium]
MSLPATGLAGAISSAGVDVSARILPSVVQVQSGRRGTGAGTIWDSGGFVLTNDHVVAGPEARVVLADDREFEAKVEGRSRRLDLALLQLREVPEDLRAAPLGDSSLLRVGELVFAIGNPWGRRGAVTAGIVSGVGPTPGFRSGTHHIQSDASLAPGNSGGPLVNSRGEVVGINAMISGGLSLSVPSNVAREWAGSDRSPKPRLGISVRPIDARPPRGRRRRPSRRTSELMVVAVEEGGAADKAGMLVGDVLLEAVGESPRLSLSEVVDRNAGGTLRFRTLRGGEPLILEVALPEPGK